MAGTEAQRAWVTRVLGHVFAAPARGADGNADLLKIWIAAKEQIDDAIGALQTSLSGTGDPDLRQIAEYGLYGLGKGQNVRMMAALREMAAGAPTGPAKLEGAVEEYRAFLDGAVVDLLEDNPFGAPVPLRAVLGGALDTLARSLPH